MNVYAVRAICYSFSFNLRKKLSQLVHVIETDFILSVESQKGAIIIWQCSVENQKGAIAVQSLCQ